MEVCRRMSVLPRNFLDKALYGDSKLPEEAFDNGSTFRKFVLHFDVEDICHQGHKRVFLPRERGKTTDKHTLNVFNVICNG